MARASIRHYPPHVCCEVKNASPDCRQIYKELLLWDRHSSQTSATFLGLNRAGQDFLQLTYNTPVDYHTMATEIARWTDIGSVPEGVRWWLERFYTLADTRGDEANREFSELFTPDGTMFGMGGKTQGRQGVQHPPKEVIFVHAI